MQWMLQMLRLQLKYVSLRLSAPTQKMLTDRANTARSRGQDAFAYQLGKLVVCQWGPLEKVTYFSSS